MRKFLRLTICLLVYLTSSGLAWAAPTVGTITNTTTVRHNNTITAITRLSVTSGTPTGYRFTSLPTTTQGTLFIANSAITAYEVATLNTVYTPQQAANIAFRAPNTAPIGTVTFTFQAGDATGFSGNGTYNLTIQTELPTVANKAAPIIPKSFGATPIKALQGSDPDGTIATYRILTLPTRGTLRVNGTIVTGAVDVSVANAGTLTYAPDATAAAGNYSFTYRATDNSGGISNTATFSLPVSNASCGQNSAIDFSERTLGENWKSQAGVTVGNTTVSTRAYTSSVPAGETDILEISNQPGVISTPGLVWQLNNRNFAGENISAVEMNFSRPIRNLAFSMEDIDISTLANGGSDFIDEVTFNAYTLGSTTPYQLAAADVALGSNNTNTFVAGTNTIKGTASNNGPGGTVVLTYPANVAISRLEIVYRNTQTYTAGNTRNQTVGIPSMVWCAEVDLITTLTGPVRWPAGQTVTYTAMTKNQGDIDAAGVQSTVQLIPGLQNVLAPAGFSYNSTSGLLTLAATGTLTPNALSSTNITFTMPATGSVTGRAQSTTTGLDVEPVNNNGSLAAANVITVQNQPPVATSATNAIVLNTAGATVLSPSLLGTDPDGTVASFLIKSLPATGSLTYNGAAVTIGTSIPANQRSLLRYTPVSGQVSTVSFNFTTVDDNNVESAAATYSIPVQNAAPSNCAVSYFDGVNAYSGLSADYVGGSFSTTNASSGDDLAYFVTRAGAGNSIKRVDPQINFTGNSTAAWGNIQPPAGGSTTDLDLFSSRYRGSIFLAKAGTYTFYTRSDDASYLWLDGAALPANGTPTAASALVNNGGQHGSVEVTSTTIRLSAGLHNVLLFFSENTGGNVFTFSYAGTAEDGTTVVKQVVPNAILCAGQSNLPPTALNVTNSPAIPNSYSRTGIAALQATDADGTVANYIIATLPTAAQGILSLNGTALTAGQQITAVQAAQLQFAPVAGFVGNATFTFHALDNTPQRSNDPATYTIQVAATSTISGTIFEDVNYGGGAGRSLSAAITSAAGFSNIGRNGATVELYDNATGLLVNGIPATATTATNGTYTFAGVPAGTYTVRAVNGTVTSTRPLATGASAVGLLPVQTFVNGDANRVGGEVPARQDASANTGSQSLAALTTGTVTPQSITIVTMVATPAPIAGVDFGFNFDAVVNTNTTGQGSLRQFILNSNALTNANLAQEGRPAGTEYTIFMLNDGRSTTLPGLRANMTPVSGYNATTKQFVVTLASGLPTISDSNTAIDGALQTALTGDNVTAVTETTTGPEVVIDFNGQSGLIASGATTRIASIGLNNARGNTPNVNIGGSGLTFLGSSASNSIVTNVTTSGNSRAGVRLEGGVTNVTVSNNVLNNNLSGTVDADGLELLGTSNTLVTGNVMNNNRGYGIFMTTAANTGNTISNNIIRNNGTGTTTPGADAGINITQGTNNLFSGNIITGNTGDGIVALSGTSGNRFTRNSIANNGGLGIDLSATTAVTGDDVTKNADGKTAASGANGLLNFPVLTRASVTSPTNGNIQIVGFAPAGSILEVFLSDVTTPAFGEGQTYLFSALEGGSLLSTSNGTTATITDNVATTGNYSSPINTLDQGSETGAQRFFFDIPLSSLTSAQRTALTTGTARLTATATTGSTTTSEFSGNVLVEQGKQLPVELTKFEAAAQTNNAVLTWATASEKNNDRFEIERSVNGTSFEVVGTVKGNGTTWSAHQYSFVDAGAGRFGHRLYYRLRQMDADSTEAFSPVRTATFAPQLVQITLYPNPTTLTTPVMLDLSALPAGTYAVTLTDMTGRTVATQSAQGGLQAKLQVSKLSAGTYLVQVRGNQVNLTQRLVKQN